jgi:hypothetical protein
MPTPNTAPIFPVTANVAFTALTAADTTKDGTSLAVLWTAGANGSRINTIELKSKGTNVASLLRVFLNNGSSFAVAANNAMIEEVSLPAIVNSETAAQPKLVINLQKEVPAGYKLAVCLATAVAAGWHVTVFGEDF